MTNREDFINGLRELADFYEARPELPLPGSRTLLNVFFFEADHKQKVVEIARSIGDCEKYYYDTLEMVALRKKFGSIDLHFNFDRDQVCERIVVATEEIPEEIIPEKVIPAHKREKVEWRCEPLLKVREEVAPL